VLKVMKVSVNPEHDKIYPEGIKNTITVVLKDGRKFTESSTYPPGHFKNPLSRAGVEDKFRRLTAERLSEKRLRSVLDILWNLDKCVNMSRAVRELAIED